MHSRPASLSLAQAQTIGAVVGRGLMSAGRWHVCAHAKHTAVEPCATAEGCTIASVPKKEREQQVNACCAVAAIEAAETAEEDTGRAAARAGEAAAAAEAAAGLGAVTADAVAAAAGLAAGMDAAADADAAVSVSFLVTMSL